MINGANGLLPILSFDAQTVWADLATVAAPHLDSQGASRLEEALGGIAHSVAVERHYIDRDYRDTFSQFHSKRFKTPDARCIRLHFFRKKIDRNDLSNSKALQQHYLGYSVIRPTRPNCIGRTLISPESRPTIKNASIRTCQENVSIQGTELTANGFPFISQDADVTVCAQASLWMLTRYFSDRYPLYPEFYPVQIGNLTRDYSVGRLFPSSGLYVWQLAEALKQIGFEPLLYSRDQYSQKPEKCFHTDYFDHLLYTYIESGIPVLAAFHNHVVVLFGHRSDYSLVGSLVPLGNCPFTFSSELSTAYVGNDDNGTPYQLLNRCLPKKKSSELIPYSIEQIEQFVVPLPEKVFLQAESFETLVKAILQRADVGYQQLSKAIASEIPILRLFLTNGRSFKKQLKERGMGSTLVEEIYRNLPLPHFIWICEISHPALYPDSVLGEISWDATRNAYEPDGWIALHYPEVLVVDRGSALNMPQDLQRFPIKNWDSYPIYRSNLQEVK
jgi:hypothetical protein